MQEKLKWTAKKITVDLLHYVRLFVFVSTKIDAFLLRDAMHARPMRHAVSVCVSVRLSVIRFVNSVKTNKHIYKKIFTIG